MLTSHIINALRDTNHIRERYVQLKKPMENKLKYTGYTFLTLMLLIIIIDRLYSFNLDHLDALKGFLGFIGVISLMTAKRIKAEE